MKTKFTKAKLKEWTDALRSGNYRQGSNYLHLDKGAVQEFCCLGVLCDLNKELLEVKNDRHPRADLSVVMYSDNESLLPQVLQDKFGINAYGALSLTELKNLTTFNDRGKTFGEIADLIEEHFEPVKEAL